MPRHRLVPALLLLLGVFFWIWDFDDGTAYAGVRHAGYLAQILEDDTATAPEDDTGLSGLWWIVALAVGAFLLLWFIRRRRQTYSPGRGTLPGQPGNYGAREPYQGQEYPAGATGAGGWGRGMLGGALGGLAGGWLYRRSRGDEGISGQNTAEGEQSPPPMRPDQGEESTGARAADYDTGGGGNDSGSSGADF